MTRDTLYDLLARGAAIAIAGFIIGLPFVIGGAIYKHFTAEPKVALVIPANDPARKCP